MGKGSVSAPKQEAPIKTVQTDEVSATSEQSAYLRKRNRGYTYNKTLLSQEGLGSSAGLQQQSTAPKTLLGQ